jgi:anti-sigma factor RsiW
MHGTPAMASCLEATRMLHAYLDGHVDERSAHRVGRHLEVCRRCGLEAATYMQIKNSLRRQQAAAPAGAVQRLTELAARLTDADLDRADGAEPGS